MKEALIILMAGGPSGHTKRMTVDLKKQAQKQKQKPTKNRQEAKLRSVTEAKKYKLKEPPVLSATKRPYKISTSNELSYTIGWKVNWYNHY